MTPQKLIILCFALLLVCTPALARKNKNLKAQPIAQPIITPIPLPPINAQQPQPEPEVTPAPANEVEYGFHDIVYDGPVLFGDAANPGTNEVENPSVEATRAV